MARVPFLRGCVLLLPLALGAVGCDCSGPTRVSPCDVDGGLSGCGTACSALRPCGLGLYCGAGGTCTADCSAAVPCEGGALCTPEGRCAGVPDAGGGFDAAGRDVRGEDVTCAAIELGTVRVTPNVLLVIDRSGSMSSNQFPPGSGITRWNALRNSLMARPDGLIDALEASVRFGLVMYREQGSIAGCPDLEVVPCALDNFGPINTVYGPANAGGGTPTGDSITAVLGMLGTLVTERADPTIIVLATDGEPDTCEDGNDEVNGRLESIAAVEAAFDMDIRTFVISVGTDVAGSHLQDVANAGLGRGPADPDAEYWVATDTTGLNAALEAIIGGVVGCEIALVGEIDPSMACTGEVRIGGDLLTCDDPDGWRAVDATHIELLGAACDRLEATGDTVTGRFPCDVVVF